MSSRIPDSWSLPLREKLLGRDGFLSFPWKRFFELLRDRLSFLGEEKTHLISNTQLSFTDIRGLRFYSGHHSLVEWEYLVQRVTKNTGGVEHLEYGKKLAVFSPKNKTWSFVATTASQGDAFVDFKITQAGQVQYKVKKQILGELVLSRVIYRTRSLAGKTKEYSLFSLNFGG